MEEANDATKHELLKNPSNIAYIEETDQITHSDLGELKHGEILVRAPRPNLTAEATHEVKVVERGISNIDDCETDEDREILDRRGPHIIRHSGGRSTVVESNADYRYYRTGLNAHDYDGEEWVELMNEIMWHDHDRRQAESFRDGL